MKKVQGKNIVGYITIHMKGENLEYFLQACINENIPIWNVKRVSENYCTGTIYYAHLKTINELANHYGYTISNEHRQGYLNYLLQLWQRKELLLAVILSTLFIFLLSNIVWKIEIVGVPSELEEKITEELAENGLYEGALTFRLSPLNILQKTVTDNIPELLYIGIDKKGTTYIVQAEEKLIAEPKEPAQAQHLIASKNGIIRKMFVKNGQPVVNVNDFVDKGTLLVSGVIDPNQQTEEEQDESESQIVSADGEVFANTWYEVNVNTSLYQSHDKLTGEYVTHYSLQMNHFNIPLWGFWKKPFSEIFVETDIQALKILRWQLPISLVKNTVYNKESISQIRSENEAKEIAIKHALYDLQLKLGMDTEILHYYVLHESVENGKVKLNLYISVLEDIAISSPIH